MKKKYIYSSKVGSSQRGTVWVRRQGSDVTGMQHFSVCRDRSYFGGTLLNTLHVVSSSQAASPGLCGKFLSSNKGFLSVVFR